MQLHRKSTPLINITLLNIIFSNKVEVLRNCIESILEKTDYSNYEIFVIDNKNSEEATFEYHKKIESNPKIKILSYPEEFNIYVT
jgi:O-antigen biosynthesis protein